MKNYLFKFEEKYPAGGSKIMVPKNINLFMPEGNDKKDFENTKIIYEMFRFITPTQASDNRLWTYLTHVKFWDYMRRRWPVDLKNDNQKKNYIKERYFLQNLNLRTLIHS